MGCVIGGKEYGHLCNFFRLAESIQRKGTLNAFNPSIIKDALFFEAQENAGLDDANGDAIRPDIVDAFLFCDAFY